MKSVMISIKPKWCELIAIGQKTVEVRKTKPKIETPFKCYIYCTKPSNKYQTVSGCMVLNSDQLYRHPKSGIRYGDSIEMELLDISEYSEDNFLNGKVIGEFVCDFIYENISYDSSDTCVSVSDMKKYASGKPLYGWHISNLVVYDRPKDIIEFKPNCKYLNDDGSCQYEKIECDCAKTDFNSDYSINMVECLNYMTRPPQSWCYVEEIE